MIIFLANDRPCLFITPRYIVRMTPELTQLFEFLRFPSVSTDSRHTGDVRACAEWLDAKLTGMGLMSTIHETAGHPIIVARNKHVEGKLNVMIYGHYDVQPVDPLELWASPPFEPVIRDGKIYARGATDNKGQMFAHVLGVEKALAEGELPVNLTFLFEGEEEIGSKNLTPFLLAHRDELACDVIAVSDTGMVAPGMPTMGYGLRGITCGDVIVTGPSSDLHSGVYGGSVMNPSTAVARIVASLHDADEKVAIDGFYADVVPLEDWEREAWGKVPFGEKEYLAETGAPASVGEAGYTVAERLWGRPTAEVNGIGGGYQGEGSKTVIGREAMAKLSFRLVPGQDPEDILDKVEAHVMAHAPKGVEVKFVRGHSGDPYLNDPHSEYGKAAQAALESTFDKEPVLIREGGSIPIINTFKTILGADSLMLGLAVPGCKIHAPNESFLVENFEAGIALNQELIRRLGALGKNS